MTPSVDVTMISADATQEEIIKIIQSSGLFVILFIKMMKTISLVFYMLEIIY